MRTRGVRILVLSVCAIAVAITGCASGPASNSGSGDCSTVVRFDGRLYKEEGFTKSVNERIGQADLAACDDTGANARGPFFPDDPKQIAVWSVPGKNSVGTVAIRYNDHTYRLMFAWND